MRVCDVGSMQIDENRFLGEKASEVKEASRRSESNGMFAAVKFLKGTSDGQPRRSTAIRNDEGVVINNEKEKATLCLPDISRNCTTLRRLQIKTS